MREKWVVFGTLGLRKLPHSVLGSRGGLGAAEPTEKATGWVPGLSGSGRIGLSLLSLRSANNHPLYFSLCAFLLLPFTSLCKAVCIYSHTMKKFSLSITQTKMGSRLTFNLLLVLYLFIPTTAKANSDFPLKFAAGSPPPPHTHFVASKLSVAELFPLGIRKDQGYNFVCLFPEGRSLFCLRSASF